jgi:hypothetical protein
MCTVSIIRTGGELIRLAANRDEQIARLPALAPQVAWFGRSRAVMPIDPSGGGTWVAANDVGVAMALLNLNRPEIPAGAGQVSRGRIIPSLIRCAGTEQAVAAASSLNARLYGAFQLVIVDRFSVGQILSDGTRLQPIHKPLSDQPLLFTSSGLGDHLVESPRRELFEQMFGSDSFTAATQDAFHAHHWPDRPHLSVCMRRHDARTVSHTTITVKSDQIDFRYHPAAPDEAAEDDLTTLNLHELAFA